MSSNDQEKYKATVEAIKQAMDFTEDEVATYVTDEHDRVIQCAGCGDVHMCMGDVAKYTHE